MNIMERFRQRRYILRYYSISIDYFSFPFLWILLTDSLMYSFISAFSFPFPGIFSIHRFIPMN